ncbi:unnamed protein product [Cladocopium goreaui]|uniref:Ribonucleoside-diphosphate reductase n=1 Tax=Cladocopium goreaui TaxID=2562237 RepID=A0A9P1DNL0_9DINO|nr:unnamed protein product [Cladocopium goreaui]
MSAPSTMKMDHFRSNLKKERLLEDRYMEIDRQNRVLLKRMSEAMRKPGSPRHLVMGFWAEMGQAAGAQTRQLG